MSDFYQLTPEQQTPLLEKLVRKALPHWGITDSAEVDLIKNRENAVFSIWADNQRYAIRVHRANYHTNEALASELQWMQALDNAGVHTPKIIPALDGDLLKVISAEGVPEPRQVDLLAWIDGSPLCLVGEEQDNTDELIHSYRIAGELAGRLHNQTEHWNRPQDFVRHAWDADGLLGDQPLWGRFWELAALTQEQQALVQRGREQARRELDAFGQDDDRYGLIHADFLPENLLRDQQGEIRIIDFDDCGFGWHLFELATALFPHCGQPYYNDLKGALIEGYRQARPLPESQLALLPTFLVIRGMVYMGWMHTRHETESAREMTPWLVQTTCGLLHNYLNDAPES